MPGAMTLAAVLFGILLILKAAPDTAMARFLHRWLVRQPAEALNRVSAGQLAATLVIMMVAGLLIYAESGEGLRLLGLATPELLGWIAAFDIATTADLDQDNWVRVAWDVGIQCEGSCERDGPLDRHCPGADLAPGPLLACQVCPGDATGQAVSRFACRGEMGRTRRADQ